MKKTWEGINNLIQRKGRSSKPMRSLKKINDDRLTQDPAALPNILNHHFASIGHKLAADISHSEHHYSDYLVDEKFIIIPSSSNQ